MEKNTNNYNLKLVPLSSAELCSIFQIIIEEELNGKLKSSVLVPSLVESFKPVSPSDRCGGVQSVLV